MKAETANFYDKKFDMGKPQMELLPFDALVEVAGVLTYGAKKYAADSWRHIPDAKNRYAGALLRHLAAHLSGESVDQESGLRHISHVACNALFLVALCLADEERPA